jgi:hypothetical protein
MLAAEVVDEVGADEAAAACYENHGGGIHSHSGLVFGEGYYNAPVSNTPSRSALSPQGS